MQLWKFPWYLIGELNNKKELATRRPMRASHVEKNGSCKNPDVGTGLAFSRIERNPVWLVKSGKVEGSFEIK